MVQLHFKPHDLAPDREQGVLCLHQQFKVKEAQGGCITVQRLSLIPVTHMVGQNQLPQIVL